MSILSRWLKRPIILTADNSQGPWGGGGGGSDENGAGPRNPWAQPPGGRKPTGAKPTALDEFLKKARMPGGGGTGGGGRPQLPMGANPRALWLIGVGLLVAVWVIFTSFHQIGPQQRGVVTFFGGYSGMLEPGSA